MRSLLIWKGPFVCHTNCDTVHLFIIHEVPFVEHIYEDRNIINSFNDVCLSQPVFGYLTFRMLGERSNPLHHQGDLEKKKKTY